MPKERVLAYTDAVIAIIITIMVLEFKVPANSDWHSLYMMKHIFLAYILSFVFLSIYWNNHHHMFQIIERVNGKTLWANNILILCLSLIPFTTAWMSENHFEENTVVAYGIVLIGAALSYTILARVLMRIHGPKSLIAEAIKNDIKGKLSLLIYTVGTISAVWYPSFGLFLFALVALMWLIPDSRVERVRHHG